MPFFPEEARERFEVRAGGLHAGTYVPGALLCEPPLQRRKARLRVAEVLGLGLLADHECGFEGGFGNVEAEHGAR